MNLPAAVRTVRWMVRDTVRQSVSTKLFWVMTAATAVFALFCLSVDVSGDHKLDLPPGTPPLLLPKSEAAKIGVEKVKDEQIPVVSGEVSVGFGLMKIPLGRSRDDAVKFVQVWVAGTVADTLGVLLALLWTAGFLPTFLEPQHVTVLLAKPAPRWAIVVGKYAGVVGFVGLQTVLFIGLTWLALGVKTGVWTGAYWLAVPLLVLNFGVFYAVSAFFAVWTRSTVASAFGTLLFWVVCWAINFTHWHLLSSPVPGVSGGSSLLLDVAYWVLPKPVDLSGLFFDAMGATGFSARPADLAAFVERGVPAASVLTCLGFAAGTLGLTAFEFEKTEY